MKDLFNENQQEVEGNTRQVPPVTPQQAEASVPAAEPHRRRRRTERFSGLIDDQDALPVDAAAQEMPEAPETAP